MSYHKNWSILLGSSIAYHFSAATFALAKDRSYTSIEHLYFPFDQIVWYCIIAAFLMFLMMSIFVKHSTLLIDDKDSHFFLTLLSEILQNSISSLPKTNFIRMLLALWMISCIVIRSSYQGSLFEFLRHHKKMPSPTIDELRDANYQFFLRFGGNHMDAKLQ